MARTCNIEHFYNVIKFCIPEINLVYSLYSMSLAVYATLIKIYMWQSQVEIKHYSIVYFDCVAVFEEL